MLIFVTDYPAMKFLFLAYGTSGHKKVMFFRCFINRG